VAATGILTRWVDQHTPGPHYDTPLFAIDPGPFLPAFSAFADSVKGALVLTSLAAIFVIGMLRLLDPVKLRRALALVILLLTLSQVATPMQTPFALASTLFSLAIVAVIAFTCATDILSIGLGILWATLAQQVIGMVRQPSGFLQWNGWFAVGLAMLFTLAVWYASRRAYSHGTRL
jgi:hypothetical protein